MTKLAYTHRNGESTPPEVAGYYWIDEEDFSSGILWFYPDTGVWNDRTPGPTARYYGPIQDPIEATSAQAPKPQRYTIEIMVTMIDDQGIANDTCLHIGPDFGHTDQQLVIKIAEMLNQAADGYFTNQGDATPLVLPASI